MMKVPPKLQARDLGELKQQEIDLIYLIRNVYRFGEVTIITRDGVPYDILKTIERVRLGNLSTDKIDIPNKES